MRLSRPAMLLASRMSSAFIINPQKPELVIIDMSHLFHFSGLVGYFSAWCCIDPYARQSDVALNFRLPYLQQVVVMSLSALSTPLLGQESLASRTMFNLYPDYALIGDFGNLFFWCCGEQLFIISRHPGFCQWFIDSGPALPICIEGWFI